MGKCGSLAKQPAKEVVHTTFLELSFQETHHGLHGRIKS